MKKTIEKLAALLNLEDNAQIAKYFGVHVDTIYKAKAGRKSRLEKTFKILAEVLGDLPPEKLEKYKVKTPPPKKKAPTERMTEAEKAGALFFGKSADEQDGSKKKLKSLIEKLPPRSQVIKNLSGYQVNIPDGAGFRPFRSVNLEKALIEATNHAELQAVFEASPQPVAYKYSRSGNFLEPA